MVLTIIGVALISALITARAVKLIADDRLTEKPRAWLTTKLVGHPLLGYLSTCPWCLSVWVSLPVTVLVSWGANFLRPQLLLAWAVATFLAPVALNWAQPAEPPAAPPMFGTFPPIPPVGK